eukprot:897522-Pelagomonas_calceolata.AAC.1
MDVCSADRLAQHDLQITEPISNRVAPPYLFDPSIPDQGRHTSSRPDAILPRSCQWSLLALLTQIDHLLPPYIGYSAV